MPQSKEAKQIIALVDKAAALTESKGKSAFPEFKKKGSEWLKGETYIFIIDMNGTMLMHPANPQLETKNVLDLKDENGKAFVREFIETAKKGWVGWIICGINRVKKNLPRSKLYQESENA